MNSPSRMTVGEAKKLLGLNGRGKPDSQAIEKAYTENIRQWSTAMSCALSPEDRERAADAIALLGEAKKVCLGSLSATVSTGPSYQAGHTTYSPPPPINPLLNWLTGLGWSMSSFWWSCLALIRRIRMSIGFPFLWFHSILGVFLSILSVFFKILSEYPKFRDILATVFVIVFLYLISGEDPETPPGNVPKNSNVTHTQETTDTKPKDLESNATLPIRSRPASKVEENKSKAANAPAHEPIGRRPGKRPTANMNPKEKEESDRVDIGKASIPGRDNGKARGKKPARKAETKRTSAPQATVNLLHEKDLEPRVNRKEREDTRVDMGKADIPERDNGKAQGKGPARKTEIKKVHAPKATVNLPPDKDLKLHVGRNNREYARIDVRKTGIPGKDSGKTRDKNTTREAETKRASTSQDNDTSEASDRDCLVLAMSAYRNSNYKQAMELATEAIRLSRFESILGQAHVIRGACHYRMKERRSARQEFIVAKFCGIRSIDSNVFPEGVVVFFERAER